MLNQPETTADRPVALVTGASYGIGAACALALARDGFDIAATEIKADALNELAAAVEAEGARFLGLSLDLRIDEAPSHTVAEANRHYGRIDVLINNAGVPLTKSVLEVSEKEFLEVMRINVAGSYFMAQQVARYLIGVGRPGSIVNLASTFTAIGVPNISVYGISKAAIGGMTRHLAVEWAEHGIRVNAVGPGAVETKIRKQAFAATPEFREAYKNKVPMKRFGAAEEVAEAACYLAGERSSYVTGQVIYVDGGLTAS